MSINYEDLNLKGKLVVHADRKLNFLMGPIKSYYGMNNIALIMDYAKHYEKLSVKKTGFYISLEMVKACQIRLMQFLNT